MRVLTVEDLGIETSEGVEATALELRLASHHLSSETLVPRVRQETFIRERFSTKLEDPQTGRWIRSWRADGG